MLRRAALLFPLLWCSLASAKRVAPVPRIAQRAPLGASSSWRGEWRCGPTNMAMIAGAHGHLQHLTQAQLVERLDAVDGQINHGTLFTEIGPMAHSLGLHMSEAKYFDEAWLRDRLAQNDLVIVHGNAQLLPRGDHNPRRIDGHYVLVTKADDSGFWVHDPWPELDTIGRFHITAAELESFSAGYPMMRGRRAALFAVGDQASQY